jgi:hypothetical protein
MGKERSGTHPSIGKRNHALHVKYAPNVQTVSATSEYGVSNEAA